MGFSNAWIADATALALALAEGRADAPQPKRETLVGATAAQMASPNSLDATGLLYPQTAVVDLSLADGAGVIHRDPDGLFYVMALVNGVRVRFLVDTGASTIVLTHADAGRAGLLAPALKFHESAETAGGRASIARVKLAHLVAGPVERRNVDAAIVGSELGVSLLGQSWLATLQSVTITGDRMVLQ